MGNCLSCGAGDLESFYKAESIPVHSCLMMSDREAARGYRRGDLELAVCRACGFVQNVRFDASVHEYSPQYEETQSFSPRFRRFATELVEDLLDRWDLRGKTVVEIGCGKGEFLCLLSEIGNCRGIGFDPGYRPERTDSPAADRIEFVQDFWGPKYSDVTGDMVCCRHTLEHIPDVASFVRQVRKTIGDRTDTLVFFELPDVLRVLEEQAFWDIYYEHCSYFTLGSLARLFRSCDFDVLDLYKAFDDQYLMIIARPSAGAGALPLDAEADLDETLAAVDTFKRECPRLIAGWKSRLADLHAAGRRAVLWGSGSKAVSFLTTVGIEREVEYVVDINPHKHGTYLAGTGQKIVAPAFLAEYRPDLVVVMNPIYLDEIRADCRELGVDAEFEAL